MRGPLGTPSLVHYNWPHGWPHNRLHDWPKLCCQGSFALLRCFSGQNYAMWSCHTSVVTSIWEIFLVVVSIFAKNKVIWSYLKTKFSLKPFLCWRNKKLKSFFDNVNLYNVFKFIFLQWGKISFFLYFYYFNVITIAQKMIEILFPQLWLGLEIFPQIKEKLASFSEGLSAKEIFIELLFSIKFPWITSFRNQIGKSCLFVHNSIWL